MNIRQVMTNQSIGFVGGGRITRILLEGLGRYGSLPDRVVVSDTNQEALERLKERWPLIEAAPGNNALAAAQRFVVLAVPESAIAEVAAQVRPALRPESVVISLAPKITIAKLAAALGGFARIARMMPNAPAMVNTGFNPVAFSPVLTDADKRATAELGVAWGCCPQVVEEKLEAFAILTSMGPAYFWFQMYELRRLALAFGLTNAEAQLGLERLFIGLCRTMAEPGLSQEEVQGLVGAQPLKDLEPSLVEAYRTRLEAVMRQIKP